MKTHTSFCGSRCFEAIELGPFVLLVVAAVQVTLRQPYKARALALGALVATLHLLAALLATAPLADALSVKTTEVALTSGQRMQWLSCEPPSPKTHLVCVHGTFHGAWCFAERWLPRLAEKHGIAAHSISLRGTAGSPCVEKSIKLSTHAVDVAEAIALQLPEKQLALCAHSFGGPGAIEALATDEDLAGRCAGRALL